MQSSGAGSLKFSGVNLAEDNRRKKATPSGITSDETTGNDFKVADVSGNKDSDNLDNRDDKNTKVDTNDTEVKGNIFPIARTGIVPDKDDKNYPEVKVNFSPTASPKVTANINVAYVLDENDRKVTSSYIGERKPLSSKFSSFFSVHNFFFTFLFPVLFSSGPILAFLSWSPFRWIVYWEW